jgi:hypothetical protein
MEPKALQYAALHYLLSNSLDFFNVTYYVRDTLRYRALGTPEQ